MEFFKSPIGIAITAMAFAILTLAIFAFGQSQPPFPFQGESMVSGRAFQFIMPCLILWFLGFGLIMFSPRCCYERSLKGNTFIDVPKSSIVSKIGCGGMTAASYALTVYGLGNWGSGPIALGLLILAVSPFLWVDKIGLPRSYKVNVANVMPINGNV